MPNRPKVILIKWGIEQESSEKCRYNHIEGETPLGKFLITWRGWKKSPLYDLEHEHNIFGSFGWISSHNSIQEAKDDAQQIFGEKILACIYKSA